MYNISLNTIYYNLNKHKKDNILTLPLAKTIQIQNAIIEIIFNDFLKNDRSNSLKTKIIESLRYKYKITTLCKVINIKYSTYYYQHNKKPTYYEIRDMKLTKMIKKLFYNHHHRIGTTKIKAILKKTGETVGYAKIRTIMKENNLISLHRKKQKKFILPTDYDNPKYYNLINMKFNPKAPNQVWMGDITLITFKTKKLYVSFIIDLYSRIIVSYHYSQTIRATLVTVPLDKAVKKRRKHPCIFHSDRGSQYTSKQFEEKLLNYQITHSFSAKSYPFDSAPIESFIALFKLEFVKEIKEINEIKYKIHRYIEYYNNERPHRYNNYKSPNEKEEFFYKKYHITQ